MPGIGGTGKWSERKVMCYLPESCVTEKPVDGDIIWENIDIEVKSTRNSDGNTKDGKLTANQLRPMRYKVVVAVVENLPYYGVDCIVFSPDYFVKFFLTHKGQSVPDGLASSNHKLTIAEAGLFGCSFQELPQKIREAYEQGNSKKELKEFAQKRVELYEDLVNINKEFDNKLNEVPTFRT